VGGWVGGGRGTAPGGKGAVGGSLTAPQWLCNGSLPAGPAVRSGGRVCGRDGAAVRQLIVLYYLTSASPTRTDLPTHLRTHSLLSYITMS
jgi:hypothetical protein